MTPTIPRKRTTRRVGATGQIGLQSRSHDPADCGSYRLVQRIGPNRWTVVWTAPCDQHEGDPATSTLQFISIAEWARYF
jgi:hypothetical protein